MSAPARAEAFVLAWARRYTHGLPPAAAQRRRLELASDCFEQRRRGREVGAHPRAVATSMVVRTLAGVPADLAWRHQALAARRGRPLSEGGRPMGRWIKDNWWVVLGGLTSAMATALGVMLPFEDGTVGSLLGGIVIALLGMTGLAGIFVRRRPGRRVSGDLMVAAGQLPWIPFFWMVVPPIVALTVIVAAFIDISDANATGTTTVDDAGAGARTVTFGLMVALVLAVGAAAVAGSAQLALGLVVPLAAALLVHLVAVRRFAGQALMHAGVVLLLTPMISLTANGLIVIASGPDEYELSEGWEYLVESIGLAMLVTGLGLTIAGVRRGRQARPA